jgi:uncharacterized phage protein (TIGR01671 family)
MVTTRVIKFRAWHEDKRIMANVGTLHLTGDLHVSYKSGPEKTGYFFGGNNYGADWRRDECHVMQYTGLKDKNGKEVYEGDILANTSHKNMVVEYTDDGYSVGGFALGFYLRQSKDGAEIIGNIFQNPELLNS